MKPLLVSLRQRQRQSVVVLTGTCPVFLVYLDHRTFFSATGICCQHQGSPHPSQWMLPFLVVLFLCLTFSGLLFLCRLFLLERPFHTSECVMGYVRLGWFRSQEELRLTSGMRKSSSSDQESPSYSLEGFFFFVAFFLVFGDSSFVSLPLELGLPLHVSSPLLLLFLVAFSLMPPLPFGLAFSHVGLCYGVR